MSDLELFDLVTMAKSPKVSCSLGSDDAASLEVDGAKHIITADQADLLYRTMFFRGKI